LQIQHNEDIMRRIILIAFILTSFAAKAQLGYVYSTWRGADSKDLELRGESLVAPFAFPIQVLRNLTDSSNLFLTVAPGVKFSNFRFKKHYIFSDSLGQVTYEEDPDKSLVYKKGLRSLGSNLQTTSLTLSPQINYMPPFLDGSVASLGIMVEYTISGQFHRSFLEEGKLESARNKFKDNKDFFYANRLHLGLQATFRYRYLSLFGAYSFTPVFQQGKGPELYPVTFGVYIDFITPFILERMIGTGS